MGLLGNIFKEKKAADNSTKQSKKGWIPFTDVDQFVDIVNSDKPVVIFKHSTRCGVSRMVLSQFEADFDVSTDDLNMYFIDLLNYREISNAVAEKFNVIHQSPQMVIVKNGVSIADASHSEINNLDIASLIG